MGPSVQTIANVIDILLEALAQAIAKNRIFAIRYNEKKFELLTRRLERNAFGFSDDDRAWLYEHLMEKQREYGCFSNSREV